MTYCFCIVISTPCSGITHVRTYCSSSSFIKSFDRTIINICAVNTTYNNNIQEVAVGNKYIVFDSSFDFIKDIQARTVFLFISNNPFLLVKEQMKMMNIAIVMISVLGLTYGTIVCKVTAEGAETDVTCEVGDEVCSVVRIVSFFVTKCAVQTSQFPPLISLMGVHGITQRLFVTLI